MKLSFLGAGHEVTGSRKVSIGGNDETVNMATF